MIEVTASGPHPVEQVWGLVSDLERWGELLPTVTSVRRLGGPEPTGVGSVFEVRQPRLPVANYEVTSWVAGQGFTWLARSTGLVSIATHTVTATPDGSRVHLQFHWEGPLAPLVRLAASRMTRRYLEIEANTFAQGAGRIG